MFQMKTMDDKLLTLNTERQSRRSSFIRIWLLSVAVCFVSLLISGSERSNSVIFMELVETEHYSRLVSSTQFAAQGVASILIAPVVGFLSTRLSHGALLLLGVVSFVLGRLLCFFTINIYALTIFNGFISGCGIVIVPVINPCIINNIFKENRSTAMGIATLGPALGGFFWPHLLQFLLDSYNLKGMFLLSAGVSLNSLIGVLYISSYLAETKNTSGLKAEHEDKKVINDRKTETDITISEFQSEDESQPAKELSSLQDSNSDNCVKEGKSKEYFNDAKKKGKKNSYGHILSCIFTNRAFYMLTFTNIAFDFAQAGISQVLVDYMSDKGIYRHSALLIINAFAFGGIAGRLCLGWITDTGLLSASLQIALTTLIFASTLIIIVFVHNFYGLWICFLVLGLCQESVLVTNYVQYAMYFCAEEMITAMTANRFIRGFVQISRTPLTGYLRDTFKTYDYFIIAMSAIFYVIPVIFLCEEKVYGKDKNYSRLKTEDMDDN